MSSILLPAFRVSARSFQWNLWDSKEINLSVAMYAIGSRKVQNGFMETGWRELEPYIYLDFEKPAWTSVQNSEMMNMMA